MATSFDTLDDGRLTVNREYVDLLRGHGLDTFESFFADGLGELLRDVGVRSNVRLSLDCDEREFTFFLKRHQPRPFVERLASWLLFSPPLTPARAEWNNILRLERLGIHTMPPAVLGEDRATGRSFLMTTRIESASPADDFVRDNLMDDEDASSRRKLAVQLGEFARKFHATGMTHRDFYLCHVFVRDIGNDFRLHLIDLQRVAPRFLTRRWQVKDIAQLDYSRPEGAFTRADRLRFLKAYFDVDRLTLRNRRFLAAVLRRVERMKRRASAKGDEA